MPPASIGDTAVERFGRVAVRRLVAPSGFPAHFRNFEVVLPVPGSPCQRIKAGGASGLLRRHQLVNLQACTRRVVVADVAPRLGVYP